MLYSETKITNKQNNTNKPQKQITKELYSNELSSVSEREEIINYIKTNRNLKGPLTRDNTLRNLVKKAKLCLYCLKKECRTKQIEKRQPPNCKRIKWE